MDSDNASTITVTLDVQAAYVIMMQLQLALEDPWNTGWQSDATRQFLDTLIDRIADDDDSYRRALKALTPARRDITTPQEPTP
jgi:hypothetical protein